MNKRLEKRHKRAVTRAKERVVLSEPDLRTPEEIKAAREASRPAGGRGIEANVPNSVTSFRNSRATTTGSAAKTDV